ncbi:tRNA uridine-5-carboxymethylaminomethyl(34) synthesis GTPase MnmE [Candidatus Poribacteria bacterium]|nr:MAG: tRNA uridine-5-carboxymethylaminomethyl(34) synthesis GTPase MnmE [Candidatus Poribacteria bacterium]
MIEWDTIAAIATPRGEGGVGIVRVSGSLAIPIACQIFRSPRHVSVAELPSHTLNYGHVVHPAAGEIIDEVMLGIMRAPKSYTAEDVVEFNCHGGVVPLRGVLELTLKAGARLAAPGEFTKRAFLNGRLDLAQAEAVVDLIRSKTDLTRQIAIDQLSGKLSQTINALNDRLANLLAEVEASIDFPEEELDFMDLRVMKQTAQDILDDLDRLIATTSDGKLLREGVSIAILGRPNVGKSSLLNTLLQEDRAIVTEIPGTTRDTIEAPLNLGGIPLNLIDTAGIHQTTDVVEQQGVMRSKAYLDRADLLLIMFDSSRSLTEEDRELLRASKVRKSILILNKIDLPIVTSLAELHTDAPQKPVVQISLLDGKGLDGKGVEELKSAVHQELLEGETIWGDSPIVTNVRHHDALRRGRLALGHAIESFTQQMPPDLVAVDLHSSLDCLGEIVGKTTTEDILGKIFSQFCVGK